MDDYELDKDDLMDEHVRARPPWKTICAALSLLLVGIGLFITSMNFYATGHDGATAFLVLSIIVLIPGSYASFQLYGAYRRWPGYEFSTVPSYELV